MDAIYFFYFSVPGNACVIKPSEVCANVSQVLTKAIEKCVRCRVTPHRTHHRARSQSFQITFIARFVMPCHVTLSSHVVSHVMSFHVTVSDVVMFPQHNSIA